MVLTRYKSFFIYIIRKEIETQTGLNKKELVKLNYKKCQIFGRKWLIL